MKKEIDFTKTIESILDKISSAPAYAYSIPDMDKFKQHCYKSEKNLRDMAAFIGVQIIFK